MSSITIDAQTFKRMVKAVAYATAGDDRRPVLAGVHCALEGNILRLSATDGFRIAVARGALSGTPPEDFSALLIPARTLGDIAKKVPKKGGTVAIRAIFAKDRADIVVGDDGKPRGVEFSGAVPTTFSRVIEGNFPSITQLVPKAHTTEVALPRTTFLTLLKQADLFARENNDRVKLQAAAHPDGGAIAPFTISANAAEVGDFVGKVWDAATSGAGGMIAFNAGYLIDLMNATDAAEVRLRMQGPNNAGVFVPQVTGMSVQNVIMPMHLTA